MNGKKAKAARAAVYGVGGASRMRAYFTPFGAQYRPADYSYHVTDHKDRKIGVACRLWRQGYTVHADGLRQRYQQMKRTLRAGAVLR